MAVRSYRDLIVYQKSFALCLKVYEMTGNFPKSELYGLTSQMRRAAVSIPSNIAEGQRRKYRNEFVQFLSIARGSCAELETQIYLSIELKYIPSDSGKAILQDLEEVNRLLYKTIRSLEAKT